MPATKGGLGRQSDLAIGGIGGRPALYGAPGSVKHPGTERTVFYDVSESSRRIAARARRSGPSPPRFGAVWLTPGPEPPDGVGRAVIDISRGVSHLLVRPAGHRVFFQPLPGRHSRARTGIRLGRDWDGAATVGVGPRRGTSLPPRHDGRRVWLDIV
ncbi:hypothetical protein FRACA_2940001 [Frankia canadensis]|uniref:Uncharacterized protein n=1 Tax=Frankia canadensis TaxID=1836972 RepID=A0A2I2KTF5_9ACTN|nr:hypothetical protein FRACA_2940001 [Frankia canadensis]SOU56243.1 hypothetical protein FRACA_2940001 [Frankia canadensis]